jgi:hypothetical protein
VPLYREQYERMKRWYSCFAETDAGRSHDAASSDFYTDEIYAFFLNCYYLKDWIKHDGTVSPAVQNAIESHVNSSRPLRLCADICNSLKHLRLSRPQQSRSRENPSFGKKHIDFDITGPVLPKIRVKYVIDTYRNGRRVSTGGSVRSRLGSIPGRKQSVIRSGL